MAPESNHTSIRSLSRFIGSPFDGHEHDIVHIGAVQVDIAGRVVLLADIAADLETLRSGFSVMKPAATDFVDLGLQLG